MCFADDTLIVATAEEVNTAIARANEQTGLTLNQIQGLGLEVAPQKTEAVCFLGRKRVNGPLFIEIEGMRVETKKTMRYLGVILDNKLKFGQHLDHLEKKVATVSRALCRITPNLRGPRENRRRLYGNVILSVILYAAPIWSEEVSRSWKNRERLNGLMRSVNIRIIADTEPSRSRQHRCWQKCPRYIYRLR